MIIYKITNRINGKSYIGQTKHTVTERVKGHICNKSKIGKAIIKEGKENFDISVIDSADTQEELDQLERFWIAFYGTCETGYNTLIGGKPTKREYKLLANIGNSKKKKKKPSSDFTKKYTKSKREKVQKWLELKTSGSSVKGLYIGDKSIYCEYVSQFGKVSFPFPDNGKLTRNQRAFLKYELLKKYSETNNKPLYFVDKNWDL